MNNIIIYFLVFVGSLFLLMALRKKNTKIIKKHPRGDYVLKIIINKEIKTDLKTVLELLKNALFGLIPKLMDDRDLYAKWRKSGEAKIVLCGTNENINLAYDKAAMVGILASKHVLKDKALGLIVIGPGLKPTINEFTSEFKLF